MKSPQIPTSAPEKATTAETHFSSPSSFVKIPFRQAMDLLDRGAKLTSVTYKGKPISLPK